MGSHRDGQGRVGQAGPQCHGSKEFKFIIVVTEMGNC